MTLDDDGLAVVGLVSVRDPGLGQDEALGTVIALGEALARGRIDLAITIPEFAMSDLPSRLLYRERYVVAVRPQHPLARRAAMTVERFCNYDHVLVSPTGGSFEGPTDQALARLRLRRKVRYSVPSFLLMPEILETDDLVAVVPSRLLCETPSD